MNDKDLPDNVSIPRFILADQKGIPYKHLNSLEEAQGYSDGVVILEGDWGGIIFLVCPASLVKCSLSALDNLLQDLNRLVWKNQTDGTSIHYERHSVGEKIAGGMKGGQVTDGVWLHSKFSSLNLQPKVEKILRGKREKL